ncbi:polymorphic toxin type 22 domain-containing protein [Paraburkholderia sediminicola]|uniref:polymorphic toxin type 22 domain-containing protein n=1 Tax=Paraburkholderia sediminicola TaxID=458836 RepID=UPI0038BC0017
MGGGNVAGALGGTVAGDIAGTAASAATGDTLGGTLLSNLASGLAGAAAGGVLGGSAGAMSGANGALSADLYNRQLHPQEKTAAQQIAANAAAQGITNPDGSPITADQIENAMRAANNSQYGEIAATGVVVPLNANTPASAVYDTTGMKTVSDSSGNYLVQDPSMLATPSQALQNLIQQNTGGTNSPYSWNPPSATQATAPSVDPNGPFSPNWNTGDYSAGLGTSYRGLAPDYGTLNTGALSGVASGAINFYDGSTYLSGGVAQTNPSAISWKPGLSVTFGWIFGADSAKATSSFLLGDGNQTFISIPTPFKVNVSGAITHSYGGATGIELGVGAPGPLTYGVQPWGHSTQVTGPLK